MIEELYLSENALEEIPASVGKMTVLNTIKAGNNKLEEIPPELCKCLALKEVDFSGNVTRNLPSELQTNVMMVLWTIRYDW